MASGAVFQAAINMFSCYNSFYYSGVKLETTQEKGDEVIKFMQERKFGSILIPVQCIQNSVRKLSGMYEKPKHVSTEEEKILATNKNAKKTHYFQKLYTSFMFRLYDDTKDYAEKFLTCIASSNWANLLLSESFNTFLTGLVSYWLARRLRDDGKQWYERGNQSKLAIRKWAETCRWNFENKRYLLEAEEAFCNNDFDAAKLYYEKAVTSAKEHKVR